MSKVKLRINGTDTEVDQGGTILEAAQGLGIYIPTLCHHKALVPRGACRMCIVEDKGRLKAACTMPVENGMDIITDSPRIRQIRETVLQMIFTSRNHYCMYCEASGACELQDMGYRLGMDHFGFSTYENRYPVDISHPYIMLDHNRCILCGRCTRACSDLTGHYVLTERNRGVKTLIVADLDAPQGRSSCVSCGACVQVCPTGALIEKRAAYQKNRNENEKVTTVCDMCPVGCGIEVYKNPGTNAIVKIHGDWDAKPTSGILCKLGRYLTLYEERQKITSPRMRRGASVKEISAADLKGVLREKTGGAAALVDGSLYNEELALIKNIFGGRVYALRPVSPPAASTGRIEDLNTAPVVVVFRLDLDEAYGAVGSFIKRRAALNQARLVLVDAPVNTFSKLSAERVGSSEFLDRIKEFAGPDTLFVYRDLEAQEKDAISRHDAKLLWLPPETNTLGLSKHGIEHSVPEAGTLFFFGRDIPDVALDDKTFVVCFSPYENRLTRRADLVVPVRGGFERRGSFYNLEGEIKTRVPVLSPGPDGFDLEELLSGLQ
jgi:formate dehydrogenase major subunit